MFRWAGGVGVVSTPLGDTTATAAAASCVVVHVPKLQQSACPSSTVDGESILLSLSIDTLSSESARLLNSYVLMMKSPIAVLSVALNVKSSLFISPSSSQNPMPLPPFCHFHCQASTSNFLFQCNHSLPFSRRRPPLPLLPAIAVSTKASTTTYPSTMTSSSSRSRSSDDSGSGTMKCPTCNFVHHVKTDVFGNRRKSGSGRDASSSCCDYDVREIFGITATCPICLDEYSEVVALPCGHVLCKSDYQRMGGYISNGIRNQVSYDDNDDEMNNDSTDGGVLIHIRHAGQDGVNGTYRRHRGDDKNRYTAMGRFNGKDAEYAIELRVVDGKKMWYLTCQCSKNEPAVEFYRARVDERCAYPYRVRWEAATLFGTFPAPRVEVSHFGRAESC